MKRLLLIAVALSFAGCHSKLLNGPEGTPPPPPKLIIGGNAPAGSCPDVATPAGFTAQTYYGFLDQGGQVKIANESTATVFVLLRDVGTWFHLGVSPSGAYWYQRPTPDVIQYKGPYLDQKEYCVYEFTPAP